VYFLLVEAFFLAQKVWGEVLMGCSLNQMSLNKNRLAGSITENRTAGSVGDEDFDQYKHHVRDVDE